MAKNNFPIIKIERIKSTYYFYFAVHVYCCFEAIKTAQDCLFVGKDVTNNEYKVFFAVDVNENDIIKELANVYGLTIANDCIYNLPKK